jgi:hypothetical protein
MNANLLAVLLGFACCSAPVRTFAAAIDEDTAKELVKGATQTFVAFRKDAAGKTGASEIPKEFWATSIRDLKPTKVYIHMNNIVVAQKFADGMEAGVYIYEPLSSYLPMSGVHGFLLTPKPNTPGTYTLGTGVFSYEKMTTNQAVHRTGASRSGQETNRAPAAAGSGR